MWTRVLKVAKHLFSCRLSLVGKIKPVTQLGRRPTFQPWVYTRIYNNKLAECPGSYPALQLHYSGAVAQWWMNSLAFLCSKWQTRKGKKEPQHCLAWGMRIALLRHNVFHHHGTSICLAYIPACILSHIGPLWEFNSAIIMMVVSPTPVPPHRIRRTTTSKLLLLLSPQGPDLALLALRPLWRTRPWGEHGYKP